MKNYFVNAAKPLALLTVMTSAATAQTNSISLPYDTDGHYCAFDVPGELTFEELMGRISANEVLDPRLSPAANMMRSEFAHSYLWFQMQPETPSVSIQDDHIQIYNDMSAIVGTKHVIDRVERPDETMTVMNNVFNGSSITLIPSTGEIEIQLSDGSSEKAILEKFEEKRVGRTDITYRAFFPSSDIIAVYRRSSSERDDRDSYDRLIVREYDSEKDTYGSGYWLYLSKSKLHVSFNDSVEYQNPLGDDHGGASITCYAQEHQTDIPSLNHRTLTVE